MKENNRSKNGRIIGTIGVVMVLLSLFLPFAKSGKETKSLIGIAKIYITSNSSMWNDKSYETFYKAFVPIMLGLIVLFALLYLFKCLKGKKVGMIISNILIIVSYEVIKWDFADRRVVPGACDRGIAFLVMYIAFAVMILGVIFEIIESNKAKRNMSNE